MIVREEIESKFDNESQINSVSNRQSNAVFDLDEDELKRIDDVEEEEEQLEQKDKKKKGRRRLTH